jgi:hypothetical protein
MMDIGWGGSSFDKNIKDTAGMFMYLPSWELYELIKAAPVLAQNLTALDEDTITRRFHEFGGVPRHIFTPDYNYVISKLSWN